MFMSGTVLTGVFEARYLLSDRDHWNTNSLAERHDRITVYWHRQSMIGSATMRLLHYFRAFHPLYERTAS